MGDMRENGGARKHIRDLRRKGVRLLFAKGKKGVRLLFAKSSLTPFRTHKGS